MRSEPIHIGRPRKSRRPTLLESYSEVIADIINRLRPEDTDGDVLNILMFYRDEIQREEAWETYRVSWKGK